MPSKRTICTRCPQTNIRIQYIVYCVTLSRPCTHTHGTQRSTHMSTEHRAFTRNSSIFGVIFVKNSERRMQCTFLSAHWGEKHKPYLPRGALFLSSCSRCSQHTCVHTTGRMPVRYAIYLALFCANAIILLQTARVSKNVEFFFLLLSLLLLAFCCWLPSGLIHTHTHINVRAYIRTVRVLSHSLCCWVFSAQIFRMSLFIDYRAIDRVSWTLWFLRDDFLFWVCVRDPLEEWQNLNYSKYVELAVRFDKMSWWHLNIKQFFWFFICFLCVSCDTKIRH